MDVNFLVQQITKAVLENMKQKSILQKPPTECADFKNPFRVPVGISNRHVHLCQDHIKILFGDSGLTVWKELSQPGQFAAAQQLALVSYQGVIRNVRVLGPARKETQVEISPNDAVQLGLGRSVPIRESGKLQETPGITLVGPAGLLTLKQGVIIVARHIHMHPQDAQLLELTDKAVVSVKTTGERGIIFNNVVVRVSEQFKLEFHIDIDEANATYLTQQDYVEIV